MRIQQKYNIGDMATLATSNLTKNTQHEHKFKVNTKHKNEWKSNTIPHLTQQLQDWNF